ncbi:hypothetical protein CK203_081996 [Vitis vinifera]|uniref:Uncharacterized protein n=1 Tax=Vitis vinifera TaxID=29760 RepID=A0A438BWE8_VITVI|nr:hypothetical protein CK203_081996 [Vitis vinifera]
MFYTVYNWYIYRFWQLREIYSKDAEEKKHLLIQDRISDFSLIGYQNLFPDPVFDGANFQVLITFANAFHALQPLKFLHSG